MQHPDAKIVLRHSQYTRYCNTRGWITKAQQAEAFGQSRTYISRVTRGEREVNVQFIAGVLAMFQPEMRFEDFFEVVVDADCLARSA